MEQFSSTVYAVYGYSMYVYALQKRSDLYYYIGGGGFCNKLTLSVLDCKIERESGKIGIAMKFKRCINNAPSTRYTFQNLALYFKIVQNFLIVVLLWTSRYSVVRLLLNRY